MAIPDIRRHITNSVSRPPLMSRTAEWVDHDIRIFWLDIEFGEDPPRTLASIIGHPQPGRHVHHVVCQDPQGVESFRRPPGSRTANFISVGQAWRQKMLCNTDSNRDSNFS